MNLFKNKIALIAIVSTRIIASSGLNAASALPSAISELVENSAPAVVNITSQKKK